MSRFVTQDTARLDLGGGDWVVIRKGIGYGDRTSIQEKLMANLTTEQMIELDRLAEEAEKAKLEGVDNGPKAPTAAAKALEDVRLNHREANIETLLRTIVEWGGPGFTQDGEVVPITAENISALDGTAERILEEIKEVVVTKTEGFTKPPSPSQNSGSEAAQTHGATTT